MSTLLTVAIDDDDTTTGQALNRLASTVDFIRQLQRDGFTCTVTGTINVTARYVIEEPEIEPPEIPSGGPD